MRIEQSLHAAFGMARDAYHLRDLLIKIAPQAFPKFGAPPLCLLGPAVVAQLLRRHPIPGQGPIRILVAAAQVPESAERAQLWHLVPAFASITRPVRIDLVGPESRSGLKIDSGVRLDRLGLTTGVEVRVIPKTLSKHLQAEGSAPYDLSLVVSPGFVALADGWLPAGCFGKFLASSERTFMTSVGMSDALADNALLEACGYETAHEEDRFGYIPSDGPPGYAGGGFSLYLRRIVKVSKPTVLDARTVQIADVAELILGVFTASVIINMTDLESQGRTGIKPLPLPALMTPVDGGGPVTTQVMPEVSLLQFPGDSPGENEIHAMIDSLGLGFGIEASSIRPGYPAYSAMRLLGDIYPALMIELTHMGLRQLPVTIAKFAKLTPMQHVKLMFPKKDMDR